MTRLSSQILDEMWKLRDVARDGPRATDDLNSKVLRSIHSAKRPHGGSRSQGRFILARKLKWQVNKTFDTTALRGKSSSAKRLYDWSNTSHLVGDSLLSLLILSMLHVRIGILGKLAEPLRTSPRRLLRSRSILPDSFLPGFALPSPPLFLCWHRCIRHLLVPFRFDRPPLGE